MTSPIPVAPATEPGTRTLCDIVTRLERGPARPRLLRYKAAGEWRDISSAEFVSTVRSLALGLASVGVGRGDPVALLSENRPEWAAFDHALLNLGAVVVPLYPSLLSEQIQYILRHSGARILVLSSQAQLEKVLPILPALPGLGRLILLDPVAAMPTQALPWTALVREGEARHQGEPQAFDTIRSGVGPDDLASILYTSGTTGEPKGVMLTHGNFSANLRAVRRAIPINDRSVALSFLPLSHAFERLVDFACLDAGATIAYAESLEALMGNIAEIHPTFLAGVPRFYEKIYSGVREKLRGAPASRRAIVRAAFAVGRRRARARMAGRRIPLLIRLLDRPAERWVFRPFRERVFGPEIHFVISGGAPLSTEINEFLHAAGVPVREGYGLTEAAPVIAVNTPERTRLGTVGPPLEGVEVRIADDGEILVRGANVMPGYFRNEEATREALVEGWLRTGDIGRLEDGFLVITDRKKELLKTSGGKMIPPQPIENLLREDPAVGEAVLIGEGRKYVTALLVPDFQWLASYARHKGLPPRNPAELIKDPQVVDHYRRVIEAKMSALPTYERVKKFRLLPRELTAAGGELTPTQKVKRRVVEKKYADLIASMYQE